MQEKTNENKITTNGKPHSMPLHNKTKVTMQLFEPLRLPITTDNQPDAFFFNTIHSLRYLSRHDHYGVQGTVQGRAQNFRHSGVKLDELVA